MFDQLSDKLLSTLRELRGAGRLTEANMDAALRQVRLHLLEADVHYQVVKQFVDDVRAKALGQDVLDSMTPGQTVVKIIYDELTMLLGGQIRHLNLTTKPPVPIFLVGLQGAGKTTTTGKLAAFLKQKGRKPYLLPADVQRPAAIEQLKQLGSRLQVPVYPTQPKDNPVKLCERVIQEAAAVGADTILVDTAGRLHVDENLMKELKRMVEVLQPQEILLVADAMTGQDAVNIAREFHKALDLSGLVLTKMDGSARAGAALSMKAVVGVPIKFVGTGEHLDALEAFFPDRVASRILDMGDVLSLAEKASEVIDRDQAESLMQKIQKNSFDLEDFRQQLKQMKKLGSLESLMGMLPGFKQIKGKVDMAEAERELKRKEAIINSMTAKERRNIKILNGSRRQRIARGSGTRVQDVNDLVREFQAMQKMMGHFGRFGIKGMKQMMGRGGGPSR